MDFYSVLYDEGLCNRVPKNLGNVKTLERAKEVLEAFCNRFKDDFELKGIKYAEARNDDDTYVVLTYEYFGEKRDTLWIVPDSLED